MKNTITFFLLAACINIMSYAQTEADARSSRHYFGEGVAASEDAALNAAKADFVTKIKPDMRTDVQFRKLDDATCWKIANMAKTFTTQKGSRYTVIVSLPKNELKRAYAEAVMFDVIPDDGLDEFGNLRAPDAEYQPIAMIPVKVQEENKPPQEITKPQEVVRQEITGTQNAPVSQEVVRPPEVVRPSEVVAAPYDARTGNAMLDEILAAHNVFELSDFFIRERNKGSLAYGMPNTMTTPGNSYLIVYQRDGTIVAVYDKGTSMRKNLRTGVVEDYTTRYSDVRIMWFQLY